MTTTVEAGLRGVPDEDHVAFGLKEGRVIFTQDQDFLRLHASGTEHASIAFCHQQSRSIGDIILGLTLIWGVFEPQEMKNRVEYL